MEADPSLVSTSPSTKLSHSKEATIPNDFSNYELTKPVDENPIYDSMYQATSIIPAQPPRDLKGRLICGRKECAHMTFGTPSLWRQHMDRHTRPYKCAITNCSAHSEGFGSKGELRRHENSVHPQPSSFSSSSGYKKFYCPVPSCPRSYASGLSGTSSRNRPFSRKDNRQNHISRKHRDLYPSTFTAINSQAGARHITPESPDHDVYAEEEEMSIRRIISDPAVTKPAPDIEEHDRMPVDEPPTPDYVNREHSSAVATTITTATVAAIAPTAAMDEAQFHRPREQDETMKDKVDETEELRQKVKDLERDLEIWKKRVESLIDVLGSKSK
ncbi:unnamed protein product [Periconia digitata]|uniref:C2H2-type domain-containing protein n=1 Tax=Periconia digitata TaxID=1303443 RepID=A0A9W4U7L5_9PLEO|nr:unnamed protein product [Periconia digitata]